MDKKRGFIKNIDLDEFHETDLSLIEFVIFCYIKGFQDGFYCSKSYVSKCFGIQRKTVAKYLNNLVEKGYIDKKQIENKTVYMSKMTHPKVSKTTQPKVSKMTREVGKMTQGVSKMTQQSESNDSTNNNINNNNYNYFYNAQAQKEKTKTNQTYDLDEYTLRAIRDPLIFKKRED